MIYLKFATQKVALKSLCVLEAYRAVNTSGLSLCWCVREINEQSCAFLLYVVFRRTTGLCARLQPVVMLFAQGQSVLCAATTLSPLKVLPLFTFFL